MGISGLIGQFGGSDASPFGFGVPRPPLPTRDKFGLPLNWTLLTDTEEQRTERFVSVVMLLREVHDAAVYQLGTSLAKVAWKHATKGKPGRPKGRRKNPDQDAELLRNYDAASNQMDEKRRRSLPRLLAEAMKDTYPQDFPVGVGSIETRVRRLIKNREAERNARVEAVRKLAATMAASHDPFSLALQGSMLSGVGSQVALTEPTEAALEIPAMDKKPR